MKSNRVHWSIMFVVLCFTASCVSNIAEQKKKAETYKRIGSEYYNEGDYTTALKNFLEAEKLNADDPELHNYLGLTYQAKRRPDLAVVHLKKAIELRPDYSIAKNNLGTVYMELKQWDLAIPYFKEAAADLTYETPHRALSNLGGVYYNKRDYQQAEYYYRMALDAKPKFVLALHGLGMTLIATEKYTEAVDQLERAVSLAPRVPRLYYDLGEAYSLSGRYQKARESYNTVIALDPSGPLAAEAKKQLVKISGR